MAGFDDKKQFGAQRPVTAGMPCARCEQMLQDAMDGTLSAEDKAAFELHLTHCSGCADRLEEAKRGLQWLTFLKQETPEPSVDLVQRILAATIGTHAAPVMVMAGGSAPANVIPFRPKTGWRMKWQQMRSVAMQPRLAMTAAMAFFSIALTMNMLGVHLTELRMSDLKPSNIRKSFWQANSRAVRYYDNLKVVYELQARMQDMKGHSDSDNKDQDGNKKQQEQKDDHNTRKPGGSSRRDEMERRVMNALLLKDAGQLAERKEGLA